MFKLKLFPKYIKNEDQRDAFYCFIMVLGFTLYVTTYELSLMKEQYKLLFATFKYSTCLISILGTYLVSRQPYNQFYVFITALGVTAYCSIGEYFANLYLYGFVMSMLGFAILIRAKPFILYFFAIFGQIPILYLQYYKSIKPLPHVRESVIQDYISISVEFAFFIIVVFEGYSKRRRKEIQYRERFSLIGQDLNVFAHNIKSMLAAQFILQDNLEMNLDNLDEAKQLIKDKGDNLNSIISYLNDFNLLEKTHLEEVNIVQAIKKTCHLLNIPSSAFTLIENESLSKILGIKQDIDSIFINILSNAKKALEYSEEKIIIIINKQSIEFIAPFSYHFKSSSGIGEMISSRLALRNKMELSYKIQEDTYISLLNFNN